MIIIIFSQPKLYKSGYIEILEEPIRVTSLSLILKQLKHIFIFLVQNLKSYITHNAT